MVGSKSGKVGIEIPRATKSVIYHTCECSYVIRTCSVRERDIKVRLHSKFCDLSPKVVREDEVCTRILGSTAYSERHNSQIHNGTF